MKWSSILLNLKQKFKYKIVFNFDSQMKFQSHHHSPVYTEILKADSSQASSCNNIFSSYACYFAGKSSGEPKLLWSFFQVVHVLFYGPFNVGHLIVLCCIYASDCSQKHSQDGRGA